MPTVGKFIVKNYGRIGEIVFLEGKLYWEKTIMYICDKLEKILLKRPQFKIVSNFTVLHEKFIQYIEKYDIVITVSFDGPREITNKLRVSRNSVSDTYEKVIKNIARLKQRKLDVRSIECTYDMELEKSMIRASVRIGGKSELISILFGNDEFLARSWMNGKALEELLVL